MTTAQIILASAHLPPDLKHLFTERLGILIGTAPAAQYPEAVQIAWKQVQEAKRNQVSARTNHHTL